MTKSTWIFGGLLVVLAQSVMAAVITWDTPQRFDAFDDFNTEGYMAEAINIGPQVVVNSVNRGPLVFAGADILPNGSFNSNPPDGGPSDAGGAAQVVTSDAGLNTILSTSDWGPSGQTQTFTIGSRGGTLKPGSRYIVQFFALDTRGCCENRQVIYGDGNGNTITTQLGEIQGAARGVETIIGRFVADDFTQTITVGGAPGHSYLSGYYLQSVAKFVPEPGTVSMMALGLGLIAVTRRKLYTYDD